MKKIDLTEEELNIVIAILKNYPNTVFFGSRVKGTSKRFSDLDICLKDPITAYEYELLKEAFQESDLPFTVDLVEYATTDNEFKKIIDQEGINLSDLVEK